MYLQFPGNGERVHEMIIAHFGENPACFQGNRIQNAGDSSYIVNCLNTALYAKYEIPQNMPVLLWFRKSQGYQLSESRAGG